MTEEWIAVLVNWLPFLLLIVVFLLLARWQGLRWRGPSGHSLIEIYEQQVAETRKLNASLERIAVALENAPTRRPEPGLT
jgi:hypothetical protein